MGSQTPASREAPSDSVISVFNGLLVSGMYLLSTFKKKHQLHLIPQKFAKFPASTETYFAVASPRNSESSSREGTDQESSNKREYYTAWEMPVTVSTDTWLK